MAQVYCLYKRAQQAAEFTDEYQVGCFLQYFLNEAQDETREARSKKEKNLHIFKEKKRTRKGNFS